MAARTDLLNLNNESGKIHKESKMKIVRLTGLLAAVLMSYSALPVQAITLTFDDPGASGSAENFYASYGVTFSGGGLLADGYTSGKAGQPVFTHYSSGSQIGTLSKILGQNYDDSFFDIWIHFSHDVYQVAGDYLSNLGQGGKISAYDDAGSLLDSVALAAVTGPTSQVGLIGDFSFNSATAISRIHMISDASNTAALLDNLSFQPVPVPAAVWLFGSGLMGLVGLARRRAA